MARQRMKLSDQIRAAIDASPMSRYRIAQQAGVSASLMSRFMSGECDLSMSVLDRVGDLLGIGIVVLSKARGVKSAATISSKRA